MNPPNSMQKQLIQIAIVALLLIGCITVLMPFTGTLLFAVVICVTTASLRDRLLKLCGGRSSLTAALMSLILIVLLLAPLALLSGSLVDAIESGDAELAAQTMQSHLRAILTSLPLIAERYPEHFVEE